MTRPVPIVVLAGPTASGKTQLAVSLARQFDGEIVGADSVQLVRGFDVGSAKPTSDEQAGIPHHLIDAVEPDAPLDAMDYAALADAAIDAIGARGRLPIVVGGTGLYLRALVRGLVDLPKVDPRLRSALEAEVAALGAPALHARLTIVDPLASAKIHPNDAVRIVRALEVHAQTGTPLGALRHAHALGGDRRPTWFVVLDPPLDVLTPRIEARVDAMLAAGLVDEVRGLRARYGDAVRALGSVGYREVVEHLRDGVPLADTRLAMIRSTRAYARRQRNWFRAEPGVHQRVVDAADGTSTVAAAIESFLSARRGPTPG